MSVCLNCNYLLNENDNFCSKCSQKHYKKELSLRIVITDFFTDYFAFDSKFFRSIFPLFFKPGFLTKEYLSGKRMKYIPPLRMYIFISFIYFATPEIYSPSNLTETNSLHKNLVEIQLSKAKKDSLTSALNNEIELEILMKEIGIPVYYQTKIITREAIKKLVEVENYNIRNIEVYFIGKISIMMFFLLLFLALLLRLIYIRNKTVSYFNCLIFSIHLHCFAFAALTISTLLYFAWIQAFIKLTILIYILIAMKTFFNQSWKKSVFKYFILLSLYSIGFISSWIFTFLISFILF